MKTNTKRVIVTLLIAITYLVVDEYFVNERFIVFDASQIIPFIVFCFLVYAVIFGILGYIKRERVFENSRNHNSCNILDHFYQS